MLSSTSLVALAGCASTGQETTPSRTETNSTGVDSGTATPSESPTTSETATANPNTHFVDAAVDGNGSGTAGDPFGSIQTAIERARPGETVFVRAGEYTVDAPLSTVRSGEAGALITITGPSDAVVRPTKRMILFHIRHSHVRLTGLTLDGLINPSRPDSLSAYGGIVLVYCAPPHDTDEYLTDIAINPAGLGHTIRPLVVAKRATNLDIGAFKVTGLAGASYVLTGTNESHAGEIVYLGTPPSAYETRSHPWSPLDETNAVRIHHIDNSAGHPHSELVNTKMGTHDILVEYCTDGGGSQNNEPYPAASAHLQSYNATVRWCNLTAGQGYGVHVNAGAKGYLDQFEEPPMSKDRVGAGHRIIGNTITEFDDGPIAYTQTSAEMQDTVCGNAVADSDSEAATDCGSDVPTGEGVGHRGGDSPWT